MSASDILGLFKDILLILLGVRLIVMAGSIRRTLDIANEVYKRMDAAKKDSHRYSVMTEEWLRKNGIRN